MKQPLILLLCLLFSLPVITPASAMDSSDLKFGGQVRLREYQLKNIWNLDEENKSDVMRMFRIRTSLSVAANFGDNLNGVVKLTNQTYGEGISDAADNKSNKVFSENAYIDVSPFSGIPLALRIGRQNLMYGSGFILFDGQSQYGATSAYFDAIKVTLTFHKGETLDILYAKDQENRREEVAYDDVTLYGCYLTLKQTFPCQTEAYLLNRLDEWKNKTLFMVGLRVTDKLDMGLDYSLEGAVQGGETDVWRAGSPDTPVATDVDHEAFGTKLEVGFTFDIRTRPRLFAQYGYFSGDDPDTETYEGWDVYYGGSVQFGDLPAWQFCAIPKGNVTADSSMASTPGEVVYTNFNITTLGANLAFTDKFTCKVFASAVKWNEDYFNYTGTRIEEDDFGNYFQLELRYAYSKNLKMRLYAGMLDPGEAFTDTPRDPATEIFYEIDLRF